MILDSDRDRIHIRQTVQHSSLEENALGCMTGKVPRLGCGGRALVFSAVLEEDYS